MPLNQLDPVISKPINSSYKGSISTVPSEWLNPKGISEGLLEVKNNIIESPIFQPNEELITDLKKCSYFKNFINNYIFKAMPYYSNGVAVYGFSDYQMGSCRFIRSTKPKTNIETIANFNKRIELIKYMVNYHTTNDKSLLHLFNTQLDNFTQALSEKMIRDEEVSMNKHDLLPLWEKKIHENKNKIDIFRYIANKNLSSEEKNELLYKLITKNTPESVDKNALHKFITENDILSCSCLEEAKVKINQVYEEKDKEVSIHMQGLFELIQNHFFRNTSKLGLDFFRANKYPIIMTWNADDKKTLSLNTIQQKEFKQGIRRSLNDHENIEPITFSEIRHLDRNIKKFSGYIYRMIQVGNTVNFSTGLQGNWYQFKKEEFLPQSSFK